MNTIILTLNNYVRNESKRDEWDSLKRKIFIMMARWRCEGGHLVNVFWIYKL